MNAYLTSRAGPIPDMDVRWYCRNCAATKSANARRKRVTCPACGTDMVHSIWALPKTHPWRAPFDPPTPKRMKLEGCVVSVGRVRKRGVTYYRMTLDTPDGIVTGTLPRAIQPARPEALEGDRVALEAVVTWMEPGIGWYRQPRNARLA